MTDTEKLRAARKKLNDMAPLPAGGDVSAAQLSRYFAVRAQERFTKGLDGPALATHTEIAAMVGEFAAEFALRALADHAPPDETATRIWGAICDGGGIGEWLWEHLGPVTEDVRSLTLEVIENTEPPSDELAKLRRDLDMHARIRLDVEKVLDEALGTEEKDGAGEGLEGDVRLLAAQRDEARAELARFRPGEMTGTPKTEVQWAVAYGGDDPNECAGVLEYDDRAEAEEQLQWTVGGFLATRALTVWPWHRAEVTSDGE